MRRIRVLVADDSAVFRQLLAAALEQDPEVEVVGVASNGLQAVDLAGRLHPDVVTLDVEMPVLDGLGALQALVRHHGLPVVVLSAHTAQGADAALRALELGAVEVEAKPSGPWTGAGLWQLVQKIKAAARSRQRLPRRCEPVRMVAVAASTGGPGALAELFSRLPALRVPLVVVQHMPAGFTRSLARRLSEVGAMRVEEAEDGAWPEPGVAYVAPGGRQLDVREGRWAVREALPGDVLKPSADVTFSAVAEAFSPVLAVVLTGMGRDALEGCRRIKRAGGQVIAQNEATCVVYGMPRAVVEAGLADFVLPLDRIADEVARLVGGRGETRRA
ncbi:MAG: chemotaxis-specific protein-glutamate methyltransferase CheB [Armatimonadota bacterium]|nr:chemotaxis-specific protein-glutamate methyltransferase CheB [Armatimonadota bacterium]MDR5675711.1 chemotaxis-specific protein-glutamate methyltransferase CheB [Armatimonadota bacterium]MDR7396671.1 chemotaxis-specific protein-glutamate methyltransferase CheB [Armatimonadota bacterium]MDR7399090.1 chemotaxis-specific protein-glutamate methyltransferase CheB [Armatimonadota bacterium]MDR7405828.1 chemotaxis-specific protein-glutamate methyltransferase CheB [Armatimonadota bacterium]